MNIFFSLPLFLFCIAIAAVVVVVVVIVGEKSESRKTVMQSHLFAWLPSIHQSTSTTTTTRLSFLSQFSQLDAHSQTETLHMADWLVGWLFKWWECECEVKNARQVFRSVGCFSTSHYYYTLQFKQLVRFRI